MSVDCTIRTMEADLTGTACRLLKEKIGCLVHKPKRGQFPDLLLVDGRWEAEVEVGQGF